MKKTFTFVIAIVFTGLLLPLSSCEREPAADLRPTRQGAARVGTQSLAEIVINSPVHTLLEAAVIRAGLAGTLSNPGDFTVFAPTDDAFRAAGFPNEAAINSAPIPALRRILGYHVIPGNRFFSDIFPEVEVGFNTLISPQFHVTRRGMGVTVNGIPVAQADVLASNGVIHILNSVLLPPAGNIVEVAAGNPNLTYLVAAVQRASQGSVDVQRVLGTTPLLTVFAPTNQAFIDAGFATIDAIRAADPAVLTNILTYHVLGQQVYSPNVPNNADVPTLNGATLRTTVSGSGVQVKGRSNAMASNVVIANVPTLNGVVHVIDRVLLP
ncbi:fasciclin domain-containing protein [Rudanella lutea]|uniref:fasciclin domain-containing protein n=1 Tax=Rudanella lutea TaxID=451374 RepID=UPI00036405F4|nr:fasciclin domain-containing protein [Rudanella lutea]